MAIVQSLFAQMATCSKKCFNSTTIKENPREVVVLLKRLGKAQGFSPNLVSSEERDGKLYVNFVDYKKEPDKTKEVLSLKEAFIKVLRHLQISHETTDSKDTYIVNLPPLK